MQAASKNDRGHTIFAIALNDPLRIRVDTVIIFIAIIALIALSGEGVLTMSTCPSP